jgi:6-phosphofructokinase 1
MGRHTGWIALYSGISAGADVIVIPEYPLTVEEIAEVVENRRRKGRKFSLLVVAEGVRYSDQKVQNVGIHIQRKLAELLKIETRFVEVGYVLRGEARARMTGLWHILWEILLMNFYQKVNLGK